MKKIFTLFVIAFSAAAIAACGDQDPGALGPSGVDGGLSAEGARQEYVEGIGRALTQLGSAQGEGFSRAIDAGNKRQLQTSAIAWRQGGEQLKSVNPPTDVVDAHQRLIKAVDGLSAWNNRIVKAAPNKAQTRKLAKQATNSPASKAFEKAVCDIVDAGYEIIDPAACGTPLSKADGVG